VSLLKILQCPATGNKLQLDAGDSFVRVVNSDLAYSTTDGIIDFCPGVQDHISDSDDAFAPRYDACMKSGASPGTLTRLWNRIIWGMSDVRGFVDDVLAQLPSEFEGVLLDVPVGTGLFTKSLYARSPKATVVGIDYSMGMLQLARKRFAEHRSTNVHLIRADAARLPVSDGAVDVVLSMSGIHVCADKSRVIAEMR
jgi:ubiquinone/menaquinone biosynthesis C-methylase UbiE